MQQQATTTSNWNPLIPNLSRMAGSRVCEICGRQVMPDAVDWFAPWQEALNNPLMKEWNRVWDNLVGTWMQTVTPGLGQATHRGTSRKKHSDCCSCCEPDDCHCRCCIVNADLVVYARVGERRVVPITIENRIRRAREIELQLSDWTTHCKDDIKVEARIAGEQKFTLEPCADHALIVVVQTALDPAKSASDKSTDKAGADKVNEQPKAADRQAQLGDVGECCVYYADLRVKGCDIRPIRIALAILPRDCGDYQVECGCGCCC
jgi:hypothetical protein